MVLPEGRLRLYQAMQSLQAAAPAAAAGGAAHHHHHHGQQPHISNLKASSAAAGLGGSKKHADTARDPSLFYRSSTLNASQIRRESKDGGGTSCCSGRSKQARQPMPIGAPFWRRFSVAMHVLCLGELRHALMAHSCLGVPGIITLLSNLSVTSDFEVENLEKVRCRVRTQVQPDVLHASPGCMN
jgi:hypothetical protein